MTNANFLAANGSALLQLLEHHYGLRGELTVLPGELDANLRLRDGDQSWLVKVAAEDSEPNLIDLQVAALDHIAQHPKCDDVTPRVIRNHTGDYSCELETATGTRPVWITTWIEGQLFAQLPHVDENHCHLLGATLGQITLALSNFSHQNAKRQLKWDLCQASWIERDMEAIEDTQLRHLVTDAYTDFERIETSLAKVRQGVIHNDANDYNLLVTATNKARHMRVIDFGDMCHSVIVGDVAIAAAYAGMHLSDPLQAIDSVVAGFHNCMELSDQELALVMPLIRMRLAVSVTNASIQQRLRPDDPYVTISQVGARRLLRVLHGRDNRVAHERLRRACKLPPTLPPARIAEHLCKNAAQHHRVLATAAPMEMAAVLDLSFDSTTGGDNPLEFDSTEAAHRIAQEMQQAGCEVAIGRYAEPRPIYTDAAFGNETPTGNRRTVHLGIDLFAPAGTEVMAPIAGHVHSTDVCNSDLDYGGLVVLKHQLPDGTAFGSLYGHLDPESIAGLCPGQPIDAGETFAQLGDKHSNGGWPPHLHLQILAADPAELPDVPRGVADPDDLDDHQLIYPDPSSLLGLPDKRAVYCDPSSELHSQRQQSFASNLKTSYVTPLALVRGYGHTLFDSQGRRFLDAYNNVPHVGHCHPRVTRAVQNQTALLATNTRYLHAGMQRYADRLGELLPNELSVFFFTPSGSEANELALRIARKHTGAKDVCVMDHGYHGHTIATMAMSPYKFRQQGAPAKPDWVHVTVQPDVYRGAHQGPDAGKLYADEVAAVIDALITNDRKLAGYICECLPSVGGQMELPEGFLQAVYAKVRAANGLCIADDVQTGLWRTGTHAFGFEKQEVVPDLLVLGKPLGGGFPLGAVITTPEIAASFAQGPEFFSTFGGSTVAMAAGTAVLDVLRDEGLADNARIVGKKLIHGLRQLQQTYELIGDVRGAGFFLGVELVKDRQSKTPATAAASRIKNKLRTHRVLIGTDGPHDNVLKIRPPMSFDSAAADCLITQLDKAFAAEAEQQKLMNTE